MISQKYDFFVAHQSRQAFAFLQGVGGTGIVIIIGDSTVEEGRRLTGWNQAIIFQHVEGQGPVLMRVEYHAFAGNTVIGA